MAERHKRGWIIHTMISLVVILCGYLAFRVAADDNEEESGWLTLFVDGFEDQEDIRKFPSNWTKKEGWEEFRWYQERPSATVGIIEYPLPDRPDNHVARLDATPKLHIKEMGEDMDPIVLPVITGLEEFYQKPGKARMEACFCFGPNLTRNVAFGLDIEYWEITPSKKIDWVGYINMNRDGYFLWVSGTDDRTYEPDFSDENPVNMNWVLEPDTWYVMTLTVDFGKKEFVHFGLREKEGNKHFDYDFPRDRLICDMPHDEYPSFSSLCFYALSVNYVRSTPRGSDNFIFVDDVKGYLFEGP